MKIRRVTVLSILGGLYDISAYHTYRKSLNENYFKILERQYKKVNYIVKLLIFIQTLSTFVTMFPVPLNNFVLSPSSFYKMHILCV